MSKAIAFGAAGSVVIVIGLVEPGVSSFSEVPLLYQTLPCVSKANAPVPVISTFGAAQGVTDDHAPPV